MAQQMLHACLEPLHAAVEELELGYADAAAVAAWAEQSDGDVATVRVDCELAVARLSLVLKQVIQDLERMMNTQLREGAQRFLSMCEAKT